MVVLDSTARKPVGCLSINVIDKAPMLLLISVISATVELYPIGKLQSVQHIQVIKWILMMAVWAPSI